MPTAISTSTSTTTSTSTPTITPPILPTSTATSTGTPPPFTTPIENYCGGGTNGWYNFFDCGATITQDMALAIDTPFVLLEGALIGIGCLDGPGGCVAGAAVADAIFNVLGANFEETVLSTGFSTVFTFLADVADDGHVGVNTVDAAIPAVAGYFAADPIVDAGIDAYGSGVNHGAWPGIASYIGSLFSP